jgi:PHS family inorganic phosphate transporter-like MFS transporter
VVLPRTLSSLRELAPSLSAIFFNYLSGLNVIGLGNVLWVFFACNILGLISTFFLIPETKNRDADVIDFEKWQEARGVAK